MKLQSAASFGLFGFRNFAITDTAYFTSPIADLHGEVKDAASQDQQPLLYFKQLIAAAILVP